MVSSINAIRKLLGEQEIAQAQDFLNLVYQYYENRNDPSGDIRRYTQELEKRTGFLDFPQQDAICCAANALCSAYDFAAFTEGFQRGAALTLSLLPSDADCTQRQEDTSRPL